MVATGDKTFHIAVYPWLAMGHLTPFLHLSNKLAERGHKISFLIPTKTKSRFEPLNNHPDLISFIPITVPHVDGLPSGTEITNDVPFPLFPLLLTAMDSTEPAIESLLRDLKPHFVFFDFAHWLPAVCRKLGIKSLFYATTTASSTAYFLSPERKLLEKDIMAADFKEPSPSFPVPATKLHAFEAQAVEDGAKIFFRETGSVTKRLFISLNECDAIGIKTCTEMEGSYCQYIENQFDKPVILAGPFVPGPRTPVPLEEQFSKLLGSFKIGTLVFVALGSETLLEKDQFQELILGLELTGLPFLAALRPPIEFDTIESALPEGFNDRVKGRGLAYGGWVQQPLILNHPSVGCFVTHCGFGSLSEAMVSKCQLVFLPIAGDQPINARLMSGDLNVGVEIARGEEDGLFTRDGVCKAIKTVMDNDSEVGKSVRANHAKWRKFLLSKGLEDSYIDDFSEKLHPLSL